jgi:hypothetical protein
VWFEITATEVGVFDVSAKFMGVSVEKVELVFQVFDIRVVRHEVYWFQGYAVFCLGPSSIAI